AKIWKAIRIESAADLIPVAEYDCDGILLDSKVLGEQGGSGQAFDWAILKDFKCAPPLILSGGLTAENVAAAIAAVKPAWVDVASGVEHSPGEKSAELIDAFVKAALLTQSAPTKN